MPVEFRVAGERLRLLPEGAVWLPERETVLVADLHMGKAQAFRRLGVPVPGGTTADTLSRLTAVIDATAARELIVLGDFLHSAHAQAVSTMRPLALWRRRHRAMRLRLVRGNHDRHAGDPGAALDVDVVDEPLRLGRLALCHHPQPHAGAYVLAGHWHPCIAVTGRAHDRLRLPCFWFGAEGRRDVGVLPAFGSFTGMHPIDRRADDRVWALVPGGLAEVPGDPDFYTAAR